jgi:glucosamine--fructose-6-phosphate aminotransferase (isomerizing)
MCGIIGAVSDIAVTDSLIGGLRRLEYRGYDSAGIATLVNGRIDRRRAEGKLDNLEAVLKRQPIAGNIGIGHTRWATHGRPSEVNAHPHTTDRVAVVHNGIIENFDELRRELMAEGHSFNTETDTEVVAHLLTHYLQQQRTPEQAIAMAMNRLEGAFALAIIFTGHDNLLVGARRGSPLAIGFADNAMYLASDALALVPFTRKICYLEENDWAAVSRNGARIFNGGRAIERPVTQSALSGMLVGKGNYPHFMLKEICEQPTVIGDTLRTYLNPLHRKIELPLLPFDFTKVDRLTIVACGTASLAGMVGKYWFEQMAHLPVDFDVASEFRYREAPMPRDGVTIVISQSGETIDTLAALRYAKSQGQKIVSIVNVPESSIARESDVVLHTLAGPEISVASTKAFTTQLTVLGCLALAAARARQAITSDREAHLSAALMELPALTAEVLNHSDSVRDIAHHVAKARDVLFLGRGRSYPIALEGALKLKEISYIHAEGYAAGEMKHGPIALITEDVPVIIAAPPDEVFEKTISNMQEVVARGGKVVVLSDSHGLSRLGTKPWATIELPQVDSFVAPILYAIPVQLLAYHAAIAKGTDVDKPRNLAKSVTVE